MDNTYFQNIEINIQQTKTNDNSKIIYPNRELLKRKGIKGEEIKKNRVSKIPQETIDNMVNNSSKKYIKTTENIIHKITNGKRKGKIKYQTLGWKQAKEIKLYCDENNINCDIIEDKNIMQNKLKNIGIWYDIEGNIYDDGTRDYGHQYLDYRKIKQNVVYIQVIK
jgi:hypothetical protein